MAKNDIFVEGGLCVSYGSHSARRSMPTIEHLLSLLILRQFGTYFSGLDFSKFR